MIEYVLIADVNDSVEVADELGRLLKDKPVIVNVIPYNVTDVPACFKSPSQQARDLFCAKVREHGLQTMLRQTMGDDVNGACGQLVIDVKKKESAACSSTSSTHSHDIEDLTSRAKTSPTVSGVNGKQQVDRQPLRRRAPEAKRNVPVLSVSAAAVSSAAEKTIGLRWLLLVIGNM